ncbi:MAG: HD-GYP domain-containing protein [Syntrophorhabdaceae bacterium]|nr:HD-GYP domain-containing protein [Syntrophorhabdaceae bacterium]
MAYKVYVYGPKKAFPIGGLALGTRPPFNVFIQDEGLFTRVIYAGQRYGPEERSELLARGVTEVFVDAKDAPELDAYLKRTSEDVPAQNNDPETVREYLEHMRDYYQVERSFLAHQNRQIDFAIYRFFDLRLMPVAEPVNNEFASIPTELQSLRGDIVIRNEDIPRYQRYIDAVIADMAASDTRDKQKFQAIAMKEKSKTIVKDLLDDPRSGENIKKAMNIVSDLADCVLSNRDVLYDLVTLNTYDQYTYTHSVNVAVLASAIGVSRGLEKDMIQTLGVGALLHDIGKSVIPAHILNKPGRLNLREYEIMKGHVVEGARMIKFNEAVSEEARLVITQHHERLNGTGYPNGLDGEQITTLGRICAIADCYDAMTTSRPYMDAGTPFQSLTHMKKEKASYDWDILDSFIRMLGRTETSESAG